MSDAPKISVVMSVFNGERYLSEAIESILNQTFRDFEFVIVDNQSTDKSSNVVSSFKDDRIVFIQNTKNLGQTRALNVGLRRSKAPYIARMDADDIAYPDRLQTQYDYLNENLNIDVVGSWCLDIDDQGRQLKIFKGPTEPFEIRSCLAGSGDLSSWPISHPTVMMKKAALEKVGFYTECEGDGYPQDYDLWSKMALEGYEFANIGRPLLKYRVLETSESRGDASRILEYRFDITRKKIARLLPGLEADQFDALGCMLEFQPQKRSQNKPPIFDLFDRYFNLFMADKGIVPRLQAAKCRLKLYYLPVLFLSHKWFSVKEYFRIIFRYPLYLFDKKYYHKLAKIMAGCLLPDQRYNFLLKKVFSLR